MISGKVCGWADDGKRKGGGAITSVTVPQGCFNAFLPKSFIELLWEMWCCPVQAPISHMEVSYQTWSDKEGIHVPGILEQALSPAKNLVVLSFRRKRWVSQESKKARCPHYPQVPFSRSFECQEWPVTSHSSFALVGAGAHHADPCLLPLWLGTSLVLVTPFSPSSPWRTWPCSSPSASSMPSLPTRNQDPCPLPSASHSPKILSKMRPLAATITFSLQEVNFLPKNKTISELLYLDFQWISLLWTPDGGCRIQPENSCWVQEGSFRIRLLCSLLLAALQINAARDLTFPGLHLSKPFLQQPEKPPQGNFLPEPKSDGQQGRDKIGED